MSKERKEGTFVISRTLNKNGAETKRQIVIKKKVGKNKFSSITVHQKARRA